MADVATYAAATAAGDVQTGSRATLTDLPKRIWVREAHTEHYMPAVFTFDTNFGNLTFKSGPAGLTAPREGDTVVHATVVNAGSWTFSDSEMRQTQPCVFADRAALATFDPVGKTLLTGTKITVLDDAGAGVQEYVCYGPVGASCTDVVPA